MNKAKAIPKSLSLLDLSWRVLAFEHLQFAIDNVLSYIYQTSFSFSPVGNLYSEVSFLSIDESENEGIKHQNKKNPGHSLIR